MATDELGQAADEYTRQHIGGMQPVETIGDKVRAAFIAGAEWGWSKGVAWAAVEAGAIEHEGQPFEAPGENPYRRIGHNHTTRDIKPLGQCPACDEYHNRNQERA